MRSTALAAALALTMMGSAHADPAEDLAKESEAACAASAKTPATPEQVVKKVDEAAALLAKEGRAAFPKFKGKNSAFIFGGTYIWIHDLEGQMVLHPIKHKMEGNRLLGLKDANGKLFFVEMNRLAKAKGTGWVDYLWPKPGEKAPSAKLSFIKLVKVGGKELILGCGLYDVPEAQMSRLVAGG